MLVTNPAVKIDTVAELVAYGKANPGKLNFGSGGNGTSAHLCLELLQTQTGARFTHIPYKATSAALVDLIAGNLDVMFDFVQTSAPHVRTGKIKALAVTSTSRTPALPQVPTMAEAGFGSVEALSWGGLFAPARTPPAIVQRLSDETTEALKAPQVKAALDAVASFTINMPHVPFQDYVNREAVKWSEVLRNAGVQPQ